MTFLVQSFAASIISLLVVTFLFFFFFFFRASLRPTSRGRWRFFEGAHWKLQIGSLQLQLAALEAASVGPIDGAKPLPVRYVDRSCHRLIHSQCCCHTGAAALFYCAILRQREYHFRFFKFLRPVGYSLLVVFFSFSTESFLPVQESPPGEWPCAMAPLSEGVLRILERPDCMV